MARTTKRPPKIQLSATRVLDLIAEKHFNGGAFAMLREVHNRTGNSYDGRDRYADALIISLWPSRGIWFGGVEVKVDRNDWLRERSSPEKSEPIQKYCNYWWVAAPPGVVQAGELPETWGHIEVGGEKPVRIAREAPRLPAEPPSATFIASVLRNATAGQARATGKARDEAYTKAQEEHSTETLTNIKAELLQAKSDLGSAQHRTKQLEDQLRILQETVESFEKDTGIPLQHSYWQRDRTRQLMRMAEALQGVDLERLREQLSFAAEQMAKARKLVTGNGI